MAFLAEVFDLELGSPRRRDKALEELRARGYKRINMDTQTKRNPISTLDDAVLWLAEIGGEVDFSAVACSVYRYRDDGEFDVAVREMGEGGFDARGTLMMATRELWEMVNK